MSVKVFQFAPELIFTNYHNAFCVFLVIKKKRKVVAQLDQVMSNYARHKRLEEQQMKFTEREPLQQRLREPVQPAITTAKVCMHILHSYVHMLYVAYMHHAYIYSTPTYVPTYVHTSGFLLEENLNCLVLSFVAIDYSST